MNRRLLFLFALALVPLATSEKFGGDSRVTNPLSLYQEGTASSTAFWTLADAGQEWATDMLKGKILQPNIGGEVYFLIKSNTADVITVYGSDSDTSEERAYRHVSDENPGSARYAILDRWSVAKVDSRWWLFDPLGNSFFIKSVNAYDVQTARMGSDFAGNSLCTNLQSKYRVSNCHEAHILGIDTLKELGFNTLGETVETVYIAPGSASTFPGKASRLLPFIGQVRISSINPLCVNGRIDTFTVNSAQLWDALDPDFESVVEYCLMNYSEVRAYNAGFRDFHSRSRWSTQYLTPYRSAKFNLPANPYYIGLDWDEEPAYLRSENANQHMGYFIIVSADSPRKQAAIAYLQEKYETISALNSAWGTNFADWNALLSLGAAQLNPILNSEPYVRDYGAFRENNLAVKADLDAIAEDFWRTYTMKVKAVFDRISAAHMLNFGPGYHGWTGDKGSSFDGITSPEYLFRGSVSSDGSVPYIDVIGVGDPMHGYHESAGDILEYMEKDLQERYSFHRRPYWHESVWITAEADSAITHTGTVTALDNSHLTDSSQYLNTDEYWADAYCGSYAAPPWFVTAGPDRHFYRIGGNFSAIGPDHTFTVVSEKSDSSWTDRAPQLPNSFSVGDQYSIVASDCIGQLGGGSHKLYIPMTQEQRAAYYVQFITDIANLEADGDYIDVGFSHWSFFDFSFRDTCAEFRNFGFSTVKGNLYDGIQATRANGEIQDCGDFTTGVSAKLNSIYDELSSCHPADLDCDGSIVDSELLSVIEKWKRGEVTISQLLLSIKMWKEG